MFQLVSNLKASIGKEKVFQGLNATADSFYGSQGRKDFNFNDANEELFQQIRNAYPDVVTMEMETFMVGYIHD